MKTHADVCEVVFTAPDPESAQALTSDLIRNKLAACGHQTAIQATYTWRGTIESNPEYRVALHTRNDLVAAVTAFIKDRHPYEVPCIITLPILAATDDYAAWIIEATTSP